MPEDVFFSTVPSIVPTTSNGISMGFITFGSVTKENVCCPGGSHRALSMPTSLTANLISIVGEEIPGIQGGWRGLLGRVCPVEVDADSRQEFLPGVKNPVTIVVEK